jgi:triacylglycerol lipase
MAGWIKSITTISTPHNGTTLVPILLDIFPFAIDLAPWLGGLHLQAINAIYNFDLEHWGLERMDDESVISYFKRIGKSPLANSKNLCTWDLSPEGSDEFNKNYQTDPDVYYFSFSTYATIAASNNIKHIPGPKMPILLRSTSRLIGASDKYDASWYENDGVCNTSSMHGPAGSIIVEYDNNPQKGVWQKMKKIHIDHQGVIGHLISKEKYSNIVVVYKNHAKFLSSLK